ncbi:MAG: GGDEF domain-containing protein [Hungatella sp.]|nr:GGDEF domain-containing protein [Hungatella sp.]
MEKQEKGRIKGFKIRTLNYSMIVAAAVLYAVLIYATFQVSVKYEKLIKTTEEYISCEKDAGLVREGSDYLTEQVRLYAITAKPEYMEAYFTEKDVSRRREKALEEMGELGNSAQAYEFLQKALDNSNRLAEREIYAMRLIAQSQGYPLESLPQEVAQVELLEEDSHISPEEMAGKGQSMVFDSEYQNAKELIRTNTEYFLEAIVTWTKDKQVDSAAVLERILTYQRLCISALFVLNTITFVLVIVLIVRPLQIYINCIKEEKMLQIAGSYEFKYLALTYNDIYEVNAANEVLLRHKAEHDPLTGVINRGAFEQMRELLKAVQDPIALLIIDVDKFKHINDNYGHETGDRILKKVARELQERFRTQDYVARIGGDEFAVIMTDCTETLKPAIQGKVDVLNHRLTHPEDGLPEISLSIGIAFSPKGFPDKLYSKADRALYIVKENGRCGCHFYEEND